MIWLPVVLWLCCGGNVAMISVVILFLVGEIREK